jgi:hypothetical protein
MLDLLYLGIQVLETLSALDRAIHSPHASTQVTVCSRFARYMSRICAIHYENTLLFVNIVCYKDLYVIVA